MPIDVQLNDLLKEAMRTKDSRTSDCIRMIKTKHMERRTAAGFKGPLDDTLWLDVIAAYQKQLRKSREEYAAIGERGADACPRSISRSAFARGFSPRPPRTTRCASVVREASCALGVSDPKAAGRVIGEIMKAQQGEARPAAVKRIVEEELAPREIEDGDEDDDGAWRGLWVAQAGPRDICRSGLKTAGARWSAARACADAGRSGGTRATRGAEARRSAQSARR